MYSGKKPPNKKAAKITKINFAGKLKNILRKFMNSNSE